MQRPMVDRQTLIPFIVFFAAALFAALYAPIQDCDEVFNYWEPSHYLNHGYGLQTWEYSPVYAIRSWTYAAIHSVSILFSRAIPLGRSKASEFYFLRLIFAFVYAGCQTKLYSVISTRINPRVAFIYIIICITSPGMFHASTAYLPSTFAMYTVMLGTAAFSNWQGGLRTAQGIMWFGIGATLGWPFAAALVLPFIAEEIIVASLAGDMISLLSRFLDGTVRALIVLAVQSAIDVFFYRKLVIVPLNIVLYNVFGGSDKGPNIYGTEPWHFYIRNLALNFNIWFLLALASIPFIIVHQLFRHQPSTRQSVLRTATLATPFYLWLAIFSLQPHKEERFMYPAYPLLALNAAVTCHIFLVNFGSHNPKELIAKVPLKLRLSLVAFVAIAAAGVGVSRTVGMVTGYSAPLKVYTPLHEPGMSRPGDSVCLGKEWYRFPSSYLLPDGVKAKFVRCDFKGLLPGEFSEAKTGFGFFPGAWLEPLGMNDENIEDPGKYTNIEHCDFLVDSYFADSSPSELEPHYVEDSDTWEKVKCEPFLDTARTGILGRLLWIPDHTLVPARFRRIWGDYCLLKRKKT